MAATNTPTLDTKKRAMLEKELERAKKAKDPGTVKLTREGEEVDANVYRPTPFFPHYYCTYRHPHTGRMVWGETASLDEVHQALQRRILPT